MIDRLAPRAVVFDLDGTLVDSRLDLAEAVNRTRARLDLPPLAVDEVLGMIGEGARSLVRKALGGDPTPALVDQALALFLAEYEPICTERTVPFAGISELLGRLSGRFELAVLTNKPERTSRKIVAACGWESLFAALIGGDSLPTRKPHPAGLLALAERFGLAPAELLLVGDSRFDAETAAAAGARCILVEWGFAPAEERELLAALDWIRSPDELAERLSLR